MARSLVLIVALAAIVSLVAGDACTLPALTAPLAGRYRWAGSPGQLSACYAAIPYLESTRTTTLAALRQVISLYSFTDLAKNSGPPYNVQVCLRCPRLPFLCIISAFILY